MRNRHSLALFSFFGLFALAGCITTRATTSPGADLTQYHSFSFYHPSTASARQLAFERSPAGQVVEERIRSDLKARGLVESTLSPEVLIAYHSKLQDKIEVTDWGYPGFYWNGGDGYSVNQYTQGTLFVDFIDPRTQQVLWRGTASAVVDHPNSPDDGKLAKAVDKLMKRYPASVAATARTTM